MPGFKAKDCPHHYLLKLERKRVDKLVFLEIDLLEIDVGGSYGTYSPRYRRGMALLNEIPVPPSPATNPCLWDGH